MIGNRGRDTAPELAVRRAAHRLGLRYRVAARPLKAVRRTADMTFPKERVAVYVDGCFWHGCPDHYVPPRRNVNYWADKITRNTERDRDTDRLMREAGWLVLRFWEHDDADAAAGVILSAVHSRR